MVEIVDIDKAPEGWFIRWTNPDVRGAGGLVHLTAAWAEDFHRHRCEVNGQNVPALNRLRHSLQTDSLTEEQAREWFPEALEGVQKTRAARKALGLKAITRDGHEDLLAVQGGAPVRPWNAAHKPDGLHDWAARNRRGK